MVISVVCNILNGDYSFYNSLTNISKRLNLELCMDNTDISFIEDFFKEIKQKIDERIDIFCVLINSYYKNDFRKKFIEFAKAQTNIKNVRIIGVRQTMIFGAIENLHISPKVGDILWIFDCNKDEIYSHKWEYCEESRWKFRGGFNIEKTFKGLNESPTIKDFKKLKSKLNTDSKSINICVFCGCTVDEKNFEIVFPEYQKISYIWKRVSDRYSSSENKKVTFLQYYNYVEWAINYGRCFLKEDEYSKYKSDILFEKNIKIVMKSKVLFENLYFTSLPFSKTVDVNNDGIEDMHIYEENIETQTIQLQKGKCSIMLFLDRNGIFYIKLNNICKKIDTSGKSSEQNECYLVPKKVSSYNSEFNAIGIDLGTTECCTAIIRKNGPDFVILDEITGLRTMPSYVAFDERMPKCGQIVVNRMRHYDEYSVYDSKRIIGKDFQTISVDPLWPFKILDVPNRVLLEVRTHNGWDKKAPEEITSVLLQHIKIKAEEYQNEKLTDVVITIPAVFSAKQKQATKKAAEIAGWKKVHFIPEPVAAAFAYFCEIDIPDKSTILICDCGGGTIDICVAKIFDGKLQILSFDGDSFLGGRDFDKMLFNHFSAISKHMYNVDVMKSTKKYILKQKCQEIKHNLSVYHEDWLDIDDFDPKIDGVIKITRKEFEEMSSSFIVKMIDVIHQTVTKANVNKNEINYVFQAGGGCRMPMIKKMLKEIFPNSEQQCSLYPDWVVAHGASLYAYQFANGNCKIKDFYSESENQLQADHEVHSSYHNDEFSSTSIFDLDFLVTLFSHPDNLFTFIATIVIICFFMLLFQNLPLFSTVFVSSIPKTEL